jgi:hypothetical protein
LDLQPPLKVPYDAESLAVLDFAAFLLPRRDYSTIMTVFPGALALDNWSHHGDFFISFDVYGEGKKLGQIHTKHCDENGYLQIDFQELTRLYDPNLTGLLIGHYHHHQRVPIEMYFSHIHLKSGTYLAYPASVFIGNKLFAHVYAEQLDNTLFWPGVSVHENFETGIMIANPFQVPLSFQMSLFVSGSERLQSKIFKVRPYRFETYLLEDVFPGSSEIIKQNQGKCGICVAAQYKVVAYVVIRHRESGAYTTMDHLHTYGLI